MLRLADGARAPHGHRRPVRRAHRRRPAGRRHRARAARTPARRRRKAGTLPPGRPAARPAGTAMRASCSNRRGRPARPLKVAPERIDAVPTSAFPTPARAPAQFAPGHRQAASDLRPALPHWQARRRRACCAEIASDAQPTTTEHDHDHRRRKGIILAGGSGTRLHPATLAISKQLLPVYDKPMIYYPLSTLMLAGIRDILHHQHAAGHAALPAAARRRQPVGHRPSVRGAAEPGRPGAGLHHRRASSSATRPSALVLGDNIFYGHDLHGLLHQRRRASRRRHVFAYHVHDPERYGVVAFDGEQARAQHRGKAARHRRATTR